MFGHIPQVLPASIERRVGPALLNFDPLASDPVLQGREAGNVAFGTRQVGDQTCGDWIANLREDDWDSEGVLSERNCSRDRSSEEHIRLQPD
jgi:hypothetical protein